MRWTASKRVFDMPPIAASPARVIVAGFVALSWLAVGCEDLGPSAPEAAKRSGVIGFIGASVDDPLWRVMYATAYRELENYPDFELKVAAPRIQSVEAQIEIIQQMRSEDLLGICIQPIDPAPLLELLNELRTKGLTVVTMINRVPADNTFFFSGLDELAIGEAMAAALREKLNDRGNIALMLDNHVDAGRRLRLVGVRKGLESAIDVNVLRELDCDNNLYTARSQARDFMERFPRLDAWICLDDWLLRRRKPGDVVLPEGCVMVTYNPLPDNWRFLEDGTCSAIIGADYGQVAVHAVRTCITAIGGEPPKIPTYVAPAITVTADNLHRFRSRWFAWRDLPLDTQSTKISSDRKKP